MEGTLIGNIPYWLRPHSTGGPRPKGTEEIGATHWTLCKPQPSPPQPQPILWHPPRSAAPADRCSICSLLQAKSGAPVYRGSI